MVSPNFKLKSLSKLDLDTLNIVEVSDRANRGYGRRFALKKGNDETKDLIFKDIFKKVQKLAGKSKGKPEELAKLKSLKAFIGKLKNVNESANLTYEKRSKWYKFRTCFHRIFDIFSASHPEKLFKFEKKIQRKIVLREQSLQLISSAAKSGGVNVIEQLIIDKANLNVRDAEGATPLGWAVANGHTNVVEMMIAAGVDVNLANSKGQTPLFFAALKNRIEIAEMLLVNQADPNIQDNTGKTALHYAAMLGNRDILETLLSNKAKPDLIDGDGNSAFTHASRLKHKHIAEILKVILTPQELIREKEILKVVVLAHSTHLGGKSVVKEVNQMLHSRPVALEGTRKSYLIYKMIKATREFSLKNSELIKNNVTSQLLDFFESGLNNNNEHIIERIQNGLPVLINTGYRGHRVNVLAWGPYFIICNRGGAMRKVVEVFKYDPTKINVEVLNKLELVSNDDAESYKKLIFEELPASLRFQPQGEFEKALEDLCKASLCKQTICNCGWTSPEAGVFNFFALSSLLAKDTGQLDENAVHNIRDPEKLEEINKKFYSWLTFVQTYNLERYLGTHVVRSAENVEKVELHAERRKATVIDRAVVQAAKKEITLNAGKAFQSDVFLSQLERIVSLAIPESESRVGDGDL